MLVVISVSFILCSSRGESLLNFDVVTGVLNDHRLTQQDGGEEKR
jgi:hypothetical protein